MKIYGIFATEFIGYDDGDNMHTAVVFIDAYTSKEDAEVMAELLNEQSSKEFMAHFWDYNVEEIEVK